MRPVLAVVMGAALAACAVGVRAQGPAGGTGEWEQLVAANNLDLKGKTPFHLAMKFQLYDLNGKPTRTGSVEEWWAAPGAKKVVVHLPGLNEDGSAPEGSVPALVRDGFLVRLLLDDAVAPVPEMPRIPKAVGTTLDGVLEMKTPVESQPAGAVIIKKVKFGKATLECVAPRNSMEGVMNETPTTVCVEPQTTDVLVVRELGDDEAVLRPRTGKFHETYVALELRIGYVQRDAIVGSVTTMEAYVPATSMVKLAAPATAMASYPVAVSTPGEMVPGSRTKFAEPVYPFRAKQLRMSGGVVLEAVIASDGTVQRLIPVASTDPMFTDAAVKAVKQWTYRPYLLNGKPVEVDTTINVNFAVAQ